MPVRAAPTQTTACSRVAALGRHTLHACICDKKLCDHSSGEKMNPKHKKFNLATARQHAVAEHDKQRAASIEQEACRKQDWLDRMRPLHERLAKFIASIPQSVQADGMPIALFVNRLKGTYRGQANARDVGLALRKLGWRRVRRWRGQDAGFSALWFPPSAPAKRTAPPILQPGEVTRLSTNPNGRA